MRQRKYRILVVDDEADICRALEFLLSRDGHEVQTAASAEDALVKLERRPADLVLSDLKMPGMDGMQLMREVSVSWPDTIFVIMTAFASVDNAVDAMKEGAADYIVKPFVNDDVKMTVARLLGHRSLELENMALKRQLGDRMASNDFIGDSALVRDMFATLEKVIPTKSNILLLGESGTGKGVVAEIIHKNSPRNGNPFLSINCSAIPETLLESELFGYRKGAFTGANTDKPGLIETADGGTLFLDEIGELPPSTQSKLLKVIETSEVMPLGGLASRKVDVRLVTATNRKLDEEIREGRFREDLFYRLDVIEFTIPPLRERREDIPMLASHFLRHFNTEHGKNIKGFTSEAESVLEAYRWPGNVRELRNAIERAVVLCSADGIGVSDLPAKVLDGGESHGGGLKDAVNYFERKVILEKLSLHGWSKEEAAQDLDIDIATLYRKMKKLGIRQD